MATEETPTAKVFDIFFSYEQQIEKKLIKLSEVLKMKFELEIFFDPKANRTQNNNEAIMKSKIFICCVTKAYTISRRCQNDIALAYTNDKPILVLMFEKLLNQDLNTIAFALSNIRKFNLYDDLKIFETWDGALFEQIVRSIETTLKRKIRKTTEDQKTVKTETKPRANIKLKTPISSLITSTAYNDREQFIPTATILSIEAEEYGTSVNEIAQHDEVLDKKCFNLERLKSNTFLEFSFGYNRMAYLKSKQRYLITSSYHKTIVSLDCNGNWIERRNPGGMLKQPWAICLNQNDEVFVGDNTLKCIFVFDSNIKHLRTIGERFLSCFYDMTVDDSTNELYAVSLYDGLIGIIDYNTGKIKKKIFISTPAYIRVTYNQIFVLSVSDFIYAINKFTLEVTYTVRVKTSKMFSGLFVDSEQNVYTTAYETNEQNDEKSKEVYLCYIILKDDIHVKRVNLGLTQVNDLVLLDNKQIAFVSDTHVDIFAFDGFFKDPSKYHLLKHE